MLAVWMRSAFIHFANNSIRILELFYGMLPEEGARRKYSTKPGAPAGSVGRVSS